MKPKGAAAVGAAWAMALAGCATTDPSTPSATPFAEAIPLCALLADPKPHIGKRVLVRGHLTRNPHGREFGDDGCDRGVLPINILQRDLPPETRKARRLRLRFQAHAARFRNRPAWVPAVYSGILMDHSPSLIAFAGSLSLESAEMEAIGRPDLP